MRLVKIAIATLAIGLIGLALWRHQPFARVANLRNLDKSLERIDAQSLLPPPLRSAIESKISNLTRAGTIAQTNEQRKLAGLAALKENSKLNRAAELRVDDMFAKQYFDHEAPDGTSVSDTATDVGYAYILVGENLALGNFTNDETLVQAWMDSPGHRANILHQRFQEIGVAVRRGTFEGKTTWLAVQVFGLPQSACPQPDDTLKARIDANQTRLEEMKRDLDQRRAEIDAYEPKYGPEYNQKVDEYNSRVSEYNSLLEQTKSLIDQYNTQVRRTNDCIAD